MNTKQRMILTELFLHLIAYSRSKRQPQSSSFPTALIINFGVFLKEIFLLASYMTDILLEITEIVYPTYNKTFRLKMLSKYTISRLYLLHCIICIQRGNKIHALNLPLILIFLNMRLWLIQTAEWEPESSIHISEALFKTGNITAACGFLWFTSLVFFNPSII